MTARLSPRFDRALAFASQLHRTQTRKATSIPYVSHLLAVASIVLEHGGTEDEAIAALLHDSVEDRSAEFGGADGLRRKLRELFGQPVVDIVDGCTDAETDPKPEWRPRKEAYVAHMRIAPRSVLLVSCADKLHNVRSIVASLRAEGETVWERFTGKKDGSLWYYRSLCDVFASRLPGALSDELGRAVDEMESLSFRQKRSV